MLFRPHPAPHAVSSVAHPGLRSSMLNQTLRALCLPPSTDNFSRALGAVHRKLGTVTIHPPGLPNHPMLPPLQAGMILVP